MLQWNAPGHSAQYSSEVYNYEYITFQKSSESSRRSSRKCLDSSPDQKQSDALRAVTLSRRPQIGVPGAAFGRHPHIQYSAPARTALHCTAPVRSRVTGP